MFKLDLVELALQGVRSDAVVDEEGVHVGCASTLAELSRQLRADPRAAGLPEDLEGAIEALLADRAAMQRAGEEMPGVSRVVSAIPSPSGLTCDEEETVARAILDFFRPHFARLTQGIDTLRQRAEGWQESAEREAAAHGLLRRTLAALDLPSDAAALEARMGAERNSHRSTHEALVRAAKERDEQCQRAERAEKQTTGLQAQLRGTETACAVLRARIAELESRTEPDSVPYPDNPDATIHKDTSKLRAAFPLPPRPEPCADVVERLAAIAWDARSIAMCKDRPGAEPVPYAELDESEKREERSYARAVISALAAMGEEAWPPGAEVGERVARAIRDELPASALFDGHEHDAATAAIAVMAQSAGLSVPVDELQSVFVRGYNGAPARAGIEDCDREGLIAVWDLIRSRFSPVIGALRTRLAEYEAAEQRQKEIEAAEADAARLLDEERYEETEAALDAMAARFGDVPEVVRLRSLMHFERMPLAPDEPDALRATMAEVEAELEHQRQRAARAEHEKAAMAHRDATHARELKEANRQVEDHARREVAATSKVRAQVAELEQRIAEAVEEEREACRDIARSIYQGNTEIPVKDTAAWYACAEFIADEMGRRG